MQKLQVKDWMSYVVITLDIGGVSHDTITRRDHFKI